MIFSTHPLHPEVTKALRALGPFRVASAPVAQAIVAESAGAEIIVVRATIPAKIIGREVTRKRFVDSSALTTAVRVLPAVMNPLTPPAPAVAI